MFSTLVSYDECVNNTQVSGHFFLGGTFLIFFHYLLKIANLYTFSMEDNTDTLEIFL